MLVHLGGEVVVDAGEVIAILDARRLRRHPAGSLLAAQGRDPAWESARSLLVTTRGIRVAPISPIAAAKRISQTPGFRRRRNG